MALTQIITLLATVLVAGWFSAFVVQFLKRSKWASWIKLALSVVVAALVALAAAWLTGDVTNFVKLWGHGLEAQQVIAFFTLVFTSAATWYRFYFKDATWAQNLGNWPSS